MLFKLFNVGSCAFLVAIPALFLGGSFAFMAKERGWRCYRALSVTWKAALAYIALSLVFGSALVWGALWVR